MCINVLVIREIDHINIINAKVCKYLSGSNLGADFEIWRKGYLYPSALQECNVFAGIIDIFLEANLFKVQYRSTMRMLTYLMFKISKYLFG